MQRNDYLIKRKFNSYLIPGVLMVMAMQLGNIVDSILVSGIIDIDGMTAISLSLPVLYFAQIIGFAIGVGGAVTISVMLGKRQIKEASGVFSVCMIADVALSLIFSALAPVVSSPLAHFLAQTPRLEELLMPYIYMYLLFTPLINVCILVSNVVTIDNCPKLGASCLVIATVVNLGLDYFFLKYTLLGMYGAGLSTVIGYGVGNFVLIPYFLSKKRMLTLNLKEGLRQLRTLWKVVKAGASQVSFLMMIILQYFVLNTFIQSTLGPDNTAVYSVCMNSVEIIKLFIEGIIGVIQTIAGVLYGEKDYYGIRRLVRRTVIIVSFVVAALMAVFIVFPDAVLTVFSFNKYEIYDAARLCVQLFSLTFIFFAANRITQVYYQTTLKTSLSTINTVLQGFVYLLPLSVLFIGTIGIMGVSVAAALTEALAFFTVFVFRIIQQKRSKLPQKGFLMIPDKDGDSLCDITIKSTEQDAVEVSKKLIESCGENGVPSETSGIIGVAAEELAVNISRYGYKKPGLSYVDINLSRVDDKLILRLRDDGVPFNPTEYKSDEDDEFLMTGIEMVRRITDKLSYTRVLNMNNTVIEVSL
ncbi:MATE family efflux transporter [Ruminococcus sp.]|uniref:MATE family efflux transporter n=1 Tax=Ruminococcus sp. TaxID=41978 RepID=UPI002E7AAE42|nr:MATE family efflux transporter [Ruminococcus sp.]MEE1261457.1 MATE family efflux transporter [Ruminococcus sp.]